MTNQKAAKSELFVGHLRKCSD